MIENILNEIDRLEKNTLFATHPNLPIERRLDQLDIFKNYDAPSKSMVLAIKAKDGNLGYWTRTSTTLKGLGSLQNYKYDGIFSSEKGEFGGSISLNSINLEKGYRNWSYRAEGYLTGVIKVYNGIKYDMKKNAKLIELTFNAKSGSYKFETSGHKFVTIQFLSSKQLVNPTVLTTVKNSVTSKVSTRAEGDYTLHTISAELINEGHNFIEFDGVEYLAGDKIIIKNLVIVEDYYETELRYAEDIYPTGSLILSKSYKADGYSFILKGVKGKYFKILHQGDGGGYYIDNPTGEPIDILISKNVAKYKNVYGMQSEVVKLTGGTLNELVIADLSPSLVEFEELRIYEGELSSDDLFSECVDKHIDLIPLVTLDKFRSYESPDLNHPLCLNAKYTVEYHDKVYVCNLSNEGVFDNPYMKIEGNFTKVNQVYGPYRLKIEGGNEHGL